VGRFLRKGVLAKEKCGRGEGEGENSGEVGEGNNNMQNWIESQKKRLNFPREKRGPSVGSRKKI